MSRLIWICSICKGIWSLGMKGLSTNHNCSRWHSKLHVFIFIHLESKTWHFMWAICLKFHALFSEQTKKNANYYYKKKKISKKKKGKVVVCYNFEWSFKELRILYGQSLPSADSRRAVVRLLEKTFTVLVNYLDDCPVKVWLGKLTALDMTPMHWSHCKASTQMEIKERALRYIFMIK